MRNDQEPRAHPDNARVIAPPPAIFVAFLALGYGAELFVPLSQVRETTWLGIGCVAVSIAATLTCLLQFRQAATAIEPWRPTTAIIERGLYRISRNPIYVAFALGHVGIALIIHSLWMLLSVAPALVIVHYGVVLREETYLAAKFGNTYRDYQARVRRWL
jgi:protein-S-isoprenylcysteine O-methyltransferase Ste14